MFSAGPLSAIAIKLTSSIDDVLWLAPFLTTNVNSTVRWQNAVIYLSVCMIQTVVAMIIAGSGSEAIAWMTANDKHAWSTDKILTVIAGSLLAVYTVKLTYEHFYGDDDAESVDEGKTNSVDSERNEETASISKDITAASEMELGLPCLLASKGVAQNSTLLEKDGFHEMKFHDVSLNSTGFHDASLSPNSRQMQENKRLIIESPTQDDDVQNNLSADKKRQQTLFMIAFIGSIDDLTLFVPMLVGQGFDWLQLMCGAAMAGSTIVMLCLFVGLCKPVADFLASIPLALIVGSFSMVLLTKGLLMQ